MYCFQLYNNVCNMTCWTTQIPMRPVRRSKLQTVESILPRIDITSFRDIPQSKPVFSFIASKQINELNLLRYPTTLLGRTVTLHQNISIFPNNLPFDMFSSRKWLSKQIPQCSIIYMLSWFWHATLRAPANAVFDWSQIDVHTTDLIQMHFKLNVYLFFCIIFSCYLTCLIEETFTKNQKHTLDLLMLALSVD